MSHKTSNVVPMWYTNKGKEKKNFPITKVVEKKKKPVITMVDLTATNSKKIFDPLLFGLLRAKTPHKHEDPVQLMVQNFCDKQEVGHISDDVGNIFVTIGKSKTLFSCHMDTVHSNPGTLDLHITTGPKEKHKGLVFATQDGKGSVLGADDKLGVWIMLKMIEAKIPGMYVFHVGEESGRVGSKFIAAQMPKMLKKYDRAVAFDRMNYTDVITSQTGGTCCSTEFTKALSEQLNAALKRKNKKKKLKYSFKGARGAFTDTATYMKLIPECTNLSVGYFSQHMHSERFDWVWLSTKLLPILLQVDWESLPTKRDPTLVPKYNGYNNGYGGWAGDYGGHTNNYSRGNRTGYRTSMPQSLTYVASWEFGDALADTLFRSENMVKKWMYKPEHELVKHIIKMNEEHLEMQDLLMRTYTFMWEMAEMGKTGPIEASDLISADFHDLEEDIGMCIWPKVNEKKVDEKDDDDVGRKEVPGRSPEAAPGMEFHSATFSLLQDDEGGSRSIPITDSVGITYTKTNARTLIKGTELYYPISGYMLPFKFYTIKGNEEFLVANKKKGGKDVQPTT